MAIQLTEQNGGKVLEIQVSGKLVRAAVSTREGL